MRYVYICYTLVLLCLSACTISRIYEVRFTETTSRGAFLSNEKMDVTVFDSRSHKRFPVDVAAIALEHLAATYPELNIYDLDKSAFFEPVDSGRITLKLNLIRHNMEDIDFSSIDDDDSSCSISLSFINTATNREAQQVAKTIIDVTLYDYRKKKKKYFRRITEKAYEGYLWQGKLYGPLQRSFQLSMDQVCSFIDQCLME